MLEFCVGAVSDLLTLQQRDITAYSFHISFKSSTCKLKILWRLHPKLQILWRLHPKEGLGIKKMRKQLKLRPAFKLTITQKIQQLRCSGNVAVRYLCSCNVIGPLSPQNHDLYKMDEQLISIIQASDQLVNIDCVGFLANRRFKI